MSFCYILLRLRNIILLLFLKFFVLLFVVLKVSFILNFMRYIEENLFKYCLVWYIFECYVNGVRFYIVFDDLRFFKFFRMWGLFLFIYGGIGIRFNSYIVLISAF